MDYASFFDRRAANPCHDCSAPCCRMLVFPHGAPGTFMDFDYIRYMMMFEDAEMLLAKDGSWSTLMHRECTRLDREHGRCTVHDSPEQPRTCFFFNPYNCWYKRNFHATQDPPDAVRMGLQGYDAVLALVQLDDAGNVLAVPTWEQARAAVRAAQGLPETPAPSGLTGGARPPARKGPVPSSLLAPFGTPAAAVAAPPDAAGGPDGPPEALDE